MKLSVVNNYLNYFFAFKNIIICKWDLNRQKVLRNNKQIMQNVNKFKYFVEFTNIAIFWSLAELQLVNKDHKDKI